MSLENQEKIGEEELFDLENPEIKDSLNQFRTLVIYLTLLKKSTMIDKNRKKTQELIKEIQENSVNKENIFFKILKTVLRKVSEEILEEINNAEMALRYCTLFNALIEGRLKLEALERAFEQRNTPE